MKKKEESHRLTCYVLPRHKLKNDDKSSVCVCVHIHIISCIYIYIYIEIYIYYAVVILLHQYHSIPTFSLKRSGPLQVSGKNQRLLPGRAFLTGRQACIVGDQVGAQLMNRTHVR